MREFTPLTNTCIDCTGIKSEFCEAFYRMDSAFVVDAAAPEVQGPMDRRIAETDPLAKELNGTDFGARLHLLKGIRCKLTSAEIEINYTNIQGD